MIKPPPIKEPWKTDPAGRLVSPPWVLWLNDLVNNSAVEELFSNTMITQTTSEISTSTVSLASDESLITIWMNF